MKTKITIVIITLSFVACSDFLQEDLQGVYTSATFYKTQTHAERAIAGVYNAASFVSTNNNLWVFGDVASDDAVKGGLAGDQSEIQFLEEFNYPRNNPALEKMWRYYYEGVTRANYLLYYGPNISMNETLKGRILGEAKFMRAYFYFILVNTFGDIPLKIDPPITIDNFNVAKSSVLEIYTQIENDLKEASQVLENQYSGADVGRATKGAALGLLAKTYLFEGKWDDVLTTIELLDGLGLYELDPLYKNNFIDSTQNNNEVIWGIRHMGGQTPRLGSYLHQYFAPSVYSGYFFNAPTQDFVNEFETTLTDVPDPRLDYTIGRQGQKWVNGEDFDPNWSPTTTYLVKKHTQPQRELYASGDADLDYVYLRYADILLMKAEALNELGRSTEALVPLNAVRKRARESYLFDKDLPGFGTVPVGLLPDITTTNKQELQTAIRHERRVELGFEFHRFYDLMRYGQAVAEDALAGTGFSYSKNRYFLIPQSEIDANPLINN